jgi:hypothetical protein
MKKKRAHIVELNHENAYSLIGRTVEIVGCGPGTVGPSENYIGRIDKIHVIDLFHSPHSPNGVLRFDNSTNLIIGDKVKIIK